MAVAQFDSKFSFEQESVARLGERENKALTEEQIKRLQESEAMQAQRRTEELCQQYTWQRESVRASTDTLFRPQEGDWEAPKSFPYERSVDYYEVLGTEEYATLEDVRAAYKKLSLIYHPDKTKGMTAQEQADHQTIFIAVKNAHLVLSDQATRRQYDRDRDYARAKAEVNGVQVHHKATIDLTDVMKRIEEMRKPPGETVIVPVKCKLEKFFYGGYKAVAQERKVKDFYEGVVTQQHTFRLNIPNGAPEPIEAFFKEQGDWHKETKPDSIQFLITTKAHPTVERHGPDLVVKETVRLAAAALQDPYVTAQVESLRGRCVLLWGRNPLYSCGAGSSGAELRVRLRGEGVAPEGHLRFTCHMPGIAEDADSVAFADRARARAFLQEISSAYAAWKSRGPQEVDLWDELLQVSEKLGVASSIGRLQRRLSAALKQTDGEWALAAKVASAVEEAESRRPSLKEFLMRTKLLPDGGFEAAGSETEEEELERDIFTACSSRCAADGHLEHGVEGLCASEAIKRRMARAGQRCSALDVELVPFGDAVNLTTSPACTLRFFASVGEADASSPQLFAVCVASPHCAKQKAKHSWSSLKDNLLPVLRATIFHLNQVARGALPRPLASYPAWADAAGGVGGSSGPASHDLPWRRLGRDAFRLGDYFRAMACYTACWTAAMEEHQKEEAAIALSNRAACCARVGDFAASLEDARQARDLLPTWGRAWSRVGAAALGSGDGFLEEALEAFLRAAELSPCSGTAAALVDLVQNLRERTMDAALAEKAKGDAAWRAKEWGRAAAHFSMAIALLPPEEAVRGDFHALGSLTLARSVLHTSRAGVYLQLRSWELAVSDARIAVAAKPENRKAHNHLGAALLASGSVEEAYAEFAWSLFMDSEDASGRKGQEACIYLAPLWQSLPARARRGRLGADLGRPTDRTRIYAISDLHMEHKPNLEWLHSLDDFEFQEDVLIVAGNIGDTISAVTNVLKILKSKFRRVFFVPGNRDVWLNPAEVRLSMFPDSFAKFWYLLKTCDDLGVDVFPSAVGHSVYVLPLFSWYNAQFDRSSRFDPNTGLDSQCQWPLDPHHELWKYMLKLNEANVERSYKGTVITFSHFVPLTALPFTNEGKEAQAMGCEDIEDQIRMARSVAHVYGHSSVRAVQEHGRVFFANNYHGFADAVLPGQEGPCGPLCIFDGQRGGLVLSDGAAHRRQRSGGDEP